jgi:type I restriction enzyme S subunit
MRSEGPEEWQEARLGEFIAVEHGYAFKSNHFSEPDDHGPIVVSVGNFKYTGGFRFDDTAVKAYSAEFPERFQLIAGDILLVMTCQTQGGEILGIPGKIPDDGRAYLHNQRLGRVDFRSSDLDPGFAYWLFLTPEFNQELCRSATGSKILHTAPSRIEAHTFDLPPLDEQRRIDTVLLALDDKIDSNRRLAALLEEVAATEARARFVDFVGESQFVETDFGRLPRGWTVAPVGDTLTIVGGGTPSTKEPRYWEGGTHCWATPKDLSGAESPVLLDTARHLTTEGVSRISSRLLPARTVLLSSRAPVGYTAMSLVELAVNQGFIAIPPSDSVPSEYVLLWLRENMDLIKAHAGGTTFAEISKRAFRPLPMALPPPAARLEFEALSRPMFDLIAGHEREIRNLSSIRDALLPKLISGEIRVPDTADPEEVIGPAAEDATAAA